MKHCLLYILILMPFYLNGMEQDQEQNKFSICNQIKKIDPNASRATYLELANNLSKNDLSTCACMKYLMQEREKKAIELIKKTNRISKEQESVIKEMYKQQQQKDANEKSGISLTIHCSPSIDPVTQARIAKKFSEKYRTTIVQTEEFCDSGISACVRRDTTLRYDGKSSAKFVVKNPEIGINSEFEKLLLNARNAALEHERTHLEENHHILRALWTSSLLKKGHKKIAFDKEEKINSKLDRAHEAAADRIPAACNDCKLASGFVELFVSFYGPTSNSTKNEFSEYPSTKKRLQWAQRIYNLKLAEQEIKKNEN